MAGETSPDCHQTPIIRVVYKVTVTRLAQTKRRWQVAGDKPPDCHQFNWSPTNSTGPRILMIRVVNKVTVTRLEPKQRGEQVAGAGETSPDCHGLLSNTCTKVPNYQSTKLPMYQSTTGSSPAVLYLHQSIAL